MANAETLTSWVLLELALSRAAHPISLDSVAEAARSVVGDGGVDAVFLSCTNLRTLDLIAPLEAELGMLVLSSNLCLARALARAAGTDVIMPGARGLWR